MKVRREAAPMGMAGARREDSAGALDSASRNPTERNAADMPGCVAAAEAS
jgi:hypothetical protein